MKLYLGIALILAALTIGITAHSKEAPKKPAPQSKTERCMAIEDFKLAMACLNNIVTEHNRERMRKSIRSY